jgi:hypothetical protein
VLKQKQKQKNVIVLKHYVSQFATFVYPIRFRVFVLLPASNFANENGQKNLQIFHFCSLPSNTQKKLDEWLPKFIYF